jgi:hypothetical protein
LNGATAEAARLVPRNARRSMSRNLPLLCRNRD